MPVIHMYLTEGRTDEQKRDLAKVFTDATAKIIGATPSAINIIFHDTSKSDFANAGMLASDT